MFVLFVKSKVLLIQSQKLVPKVTKMGSIIGHRIGYNMTPRGPGMTLTLEIGVRQFRYVTEIQKLYPAKAIRYNVNIA